jgi:hypothetical protein
VYKTLEAIPDAAYARIGHARPPLPVLERPADSIDG